MTIDVRSAFISAGVVYIEAVDCSQEHYEFVSRNRYDDGQERILTWAFDTTDRRAFWSIRSYLRAQSVTRGAKTWEDAVSSLVGHVLGTSPSWRYKIDSIDEF